MGGYAQGKLSFAKATRKEAPVYDEKNYRELLKKNENESSGIILNHFHLIVRDMMKREQVEKPDEAMKPDMAMARNAAVYLDTVIDLETAMDRLIGRYPDITVISDEIGNGIVPMDPFERAWREKTGRELICLAAEAETVIRVMAGIGQRIK